MKQKACASCSSKERIKALKEKFFVFLRLYFAQCRLWRRNSFTELTVNLFSFKGKTVFSIQEKQ
jgi:hypothetical protein